MAWTVCLFKIDYGSILDGFEMNHRAVPRHASPRSRSQVISEPSFFDDEKVFSVRLEQPVFAKSLHKHADPRPRRAAQLRQFFVRNLQFDASALL